MLRATLETVSGLVNDIESALEGMSETNWMHTAECYRIIKSWADKDVAAMRPGASNDEMGIWVGPTKEELDLIRGRV